MLIIPGCIISAATFPGVIAHEWGHYICCRMTKTAVLRVCYFRFGTPAGYVRHASPSSIWKHLLIGVGPFLTNTVMGFLVGLLTMGVIVHVNSSQYVKLGLLWLGVSIAMHAFPSTGDAQSMWRAMWTKGAPILPRIVGTPLVAAIYVGTIGSFFWLDVIYGTAIVWGLPKLLFG